MINCTIHWQNISRDEWQACLLRCQRTTILQTYYYAQAMREQKQQGARHGIIMVDGVEAGIVQAQEVGLFKNALHTLSIDRGPLWFDGFGDAAHLEGFLAEFNRQFPPRLGRKRRIMIEYYDDNAPLDLKKFKKNKKIPHYKTYMIDISPNLSDIRQNLNKKWRNRLSKSEKSDISVKIDQKLSTLSLFLKEYVQDKAEKAYGGASASFLASLCQYAARHQECLILNAQQNGKIIAAILIFIHGRGATYQAGWTSGAGRKVNAHHLLLWEAIKVLKEKKVTELDLGGHNNESVGLVTFKKGMGGHEITLIGSYG